jgi:hypothetical protein
VAYLGWRGLAAAPPWPSARRGLGKIGSRDAAEAAAAAR